MNNNIKKQTKELYNTANRLGLTDNDIECIITTTAPKHMAFSIGPNYPGGFYGTISINDCKI